MKHTDGAFQSRWTGIDALRGLAVLLMLSQHIAYWISGDWHTMPLRVIGGLGGLAAPIFVLLAGVGATLVTHRHPGSDRLLVGRGCLVLGFGYLLNLLTPSWFTMQSWYVLHMIGFGLMTTPLLRRIPNRALLVLLAGTVLATALIQHHLETPFYLYNRQMSATQLPGGWLRLALAEGFFPVFPWIAYFIAGLLSGRWLLRDTLVPLWSLAATLFILAVVLSSVYLSGVAFAGNHPWVRFFKPIPTFYPSLTPITLFLITVALFFTAACTSPRWRNALGSTNVLVCLGRCSLSLLIVHVATLRELSVYLGLFRSLPVIATLFITSALIVLFIAAALWWRKIQFKYGAEWILRKAFP
ncbi:MAG: DUF418 domain-containing transporter [Desulfatitalea sp.]|nr:DUF418 domain-containing transporter [Desulfatitalea sp.]